MHGADVFLSLFFFVQNSHLSKIANQYDNVCYILAGLGHDVGHPGVTNRFLVSTRDKIACQYNDNSVLENMHCFIMFSLMNQDSSDIFSEIPEEN